MPPNPSVLTAMKRKAAEPNQSTLESPHTTHLKPQTPSPESLQQQDQQDTISRARKENSNINVTTILGSYKRHSLIGKIQVQHYKGTKPQVPSNTHLQTIRNKLGTLLGAILNGDSYETGLQAAYELCQSICSYGEARKLYQDMYSILEKHILQEKDIIMTMMDQEDFLVTIDTHWNRLCDQLVIIRNVLMELDRRYIMHETPYDSIIHLGKQMYKKTIMEIPQVLSKTIQSLLDLIQNDRDGIKVDIDRARSVTHMMLDLSLYADNFEPRFMEATITYYSNEATKKLDELTTPDYILHAKERLQQESEQRIAAYLNKATEAPLAQVVTNQLIYSRVGIILTQGFDSMMDLDQVVPLEILYGFLLDHDLMTQLRTSFANYIKKGGLELIQDPANDQQMVPTLLQYKSKLDKILENSFDNNSSFSNALKESFESFINSRENKPAEMLAKFIDSKLRSGAKKKHQEEDIEALIDKVLVIFRYLQGKDTFEAFYKRFLSKRLLLNRMISNDIEKNILSKIKTECGPDFTRNLENMFKDMEISADINALFKETIHYAEHEHPPLTVNVLAQIVWPTYSTTDILLPTNMLHVLDAYQSFYTSRFKGRKLTWRNSMGSCVLKANYPKGRKELSVSLFQAIILLLFNDTTKSTLGYTHIATETKLDDGELKRVLQSLSCGKNKLLIKEPQNSDITDNDTFKYNDNFTASMNRLKINNIQQDQSAEERKETHTKVLVDRHYQLEAAVVRIMKSKKQMTHMDLVNELFAQLKFPIDASDIKKRIESLIDRDYLARDQCDNSIYHYQN
ncbi:hypothetical protein BC941DRAFT_417436 [Chlamydoabsidia padenii]|nr:hypothetical protein BC941DRAFT_417436 [Chlamydoabsidia padenii]